MIRRYIKCVSYCPRCKRRHEAVVPEDIVRERAQSSARLHDSKLYYCAGARGEYKLGSAYLPRVECDRCTIARVGAEHAAIIKTCEQIALENTQKWDRDHTSSATSAENRPADGDEFAIGV